MSILPKFTKIETAYIAAFLASIIAGLGYGLVDNEYFKCCEESIGVPENGTSPMKIFSNNYILSLTEMATAGLSGLYFNFHTFSIASSYMNSEGTLLALPIIFIVGFFELAGSVMMALAGIVFIETKLFKIKSKLKIRDLFFLGTSSIFIGAVFEYLILLI